MSDGIKPAGDTLSYIESLPWWARSGKLVWFGITSGLGCGLMLLASLGVALAQALAGLMGGPHGLALEFLELALAAMLVLPANLALALFLRNELNRSRDRQTPARRVSGDPSRSFPMSNEAFWVIGYLGLTVGSSIAYFTGAILGLAAPQEAADPLVPMSFVLFVGLGSLGILFLRTRGTDEPNSDEEASQNE